MLLPLKKQCHKNYRIIILNFFAARLYLYVIPENFQVYISRIFSQNLDSPFVYLLGDKEWGSTEFTETLSSPRWGSTQDFQKQTALNTKECKPGRRQFRDKEIITGKGADTTNPTIAFPLTVSCIKAHHFQHSSLTLKEDILASRERVKSVPPDTLCFFYLFNISLYIY